MSFTLYQKYESSGVDWLEKLPSHWYVKKLKQACLVFPSNVDKKSYEDEESVYLCNYTDVYYSEKIVAGMDFMKATASKEQIEKFTLKAGDTIITKDSETADDIGISAFVPDDIPGVICGYHLSIIRPKIDTDGKFIKYFFSSHFAKSKLAVAANGLTRVGLSQYAIDNLQLPYPSTTEQIAIANFLDCETTKIDALIAEQEKLMNLLREKRQSVISHAVTKGLNTRVKMKDSGVAWLGEIPEHWVVRAIKHIVSTPVTDGPHETPEFLDEGVPFVSAEAVSSGEVDFTKIRGYISEECHKQYSLKYLPKRGDIFMIKSGATTGVTAIVETDQEFNIWSPLAVIRCNRESNPYYVLNFMRSLNFQEAVALNWNFGTQQNIGMGVIENLLCPVPSLDEQIAIADYVTSFTKQFNTLIAEANSAIELLKERRSALISAAVTGQIDVRNYQPKEVA